MVAHVYIVLRLTQLQMQVQVVATNPRAMHVLQDTFQVPVMRAAQVQGVLARMGTLLQVPVLRLPMWCALEGIRVLLVEMQLGAAFALWASILQLVMATHVVYATLATLLQAMLQVPGNIFTPGLTLTGMMPERLVATCVETLQPSGIPMKTAL